MEVVIGAILAGPVAPLGKAGALSAIAKTPTAGPVAVGRLGLSGDAQADRRFHGGPEKAVPDEANVIRRTGRSCSVAPLSRPSPTRSPPSPAEGRGRAAADAARVSPARG